MTVAPIATSDPALRPRPDCLSEHVKSGHPHFRLRGLLPKCYLFCVGFVPARYLSVLYSDEQSFTASERRHVADDLNEVLGSDNAKPAACFVAGHGFPSISRSAGCVGLSDLRHGRLDQRSGCSKKPGARAGRAIRAVKGSWNLQYALIPAALMIGHHFLISAC
jgi:hypothetical protein